MSEPCILPVLPGSLSQADRRELRKAGVIVIEHNDPGSIRFLRPTSELDASDMLHCAMQALNKQIGQSAEAQRETFTRLVAAAIAAKRGE